MVRPYTKHRKPDYADRLVGLVVDWPRTWRKEYGTSAVSTLERLSRRRRVAEYYRCTIEFVKQSDSDPEWWKRYAKESRPKG